MSIEKRLENVEQEVFHRQPSLRFQARIDAFESRLGAIEQDHRKLLTIKQGPAGKQGPFGQRGNDGKDGRDGNVAECVADAVAIIRKDLFGELDQAYRDGVLDALHRVRLELFEEIEKLREEIEKLREELENVR
jgi:hypothetical protein